MKTKDFLNFIFYSSGGVFISPTSLKGRNAKLASAFRVFLSRNKEYFNVLAKHDGIAFYELTKKGSVALFGINDTLFIGQSFSQMGFYERLLRSVVAIETLQIIPVDRKAVIINNTKYSFLNEDTLVSNKKMGVICDLCSAELLADSINLIHVPKLLKNKKIARAMRTFLQVKVNEDNNAKLTNLNSNNLHLEDSKDREKEKLTNGDLVKLWEILLAEISSNINNDLSHLFNKIQLIEMSVCMNNIIEDIELDNSMAGLGKIKLYLLKIINSVEFNEWKDLTQKIKSQGDSFFGKSGILTTEEEEDRVKLKEAIEFAISDHQNAIRMNKHVKMLIEGNAPYYSINNFLKLLKFETGGDFRDEMYLVFLLGQFKSALMFYFFGNKIITEKHSDVIEQIINNDLNIPKKVMFAYYVNYGYL